MLDDKKQIIGGIIWEQDLIYTFKNLLIPQSFRIKKYPFIQFRTPQYPRLAQNAKNLQEVQNFENSYKFEKNSKFLTGPTSTVASSCNSRTQRCDQIVESYNEFDLNYKCKIGPQNKFSIFNVNAPLGEILYEENGNTPDLKNINKNPEFICFVNKA